MINKNEGDPVQNATRSTINAVNKWDEMAPIQETLRFSSLLASRCGHSRTRREQLGECALPQRVFAGKTLVCTFARIAPRMM